MNEQEIREALSKIKLITRKMIANYYSAEYLVSGDNMTSYIKCCNKSYTEGIKSAIGSINKVTSQRILKALGFKKLPDNKFVIPANCFNLIEDGTKIYTFFGEEKIIGHDEFYPESRDGMTPYYIILSNLKK